MKINLVLSGGGARGIAHLGIVKMLLESGFSLNKISGVSSGAVIGAFIAAGYPPEEVLTIFIENKLMAHVRPVFKGGIFSMIKWEKILLKYFPSNSFGDLKIPLIINATDINKCENVYFSSGELVLPLLASCTIPGIFEPITINSSKFVDGGVLDNLPVKPFISESLRIFASHVNPVSMGSYGDSTFKIVERCVLLSIREKMEKHKKNIAVYFEPEELSGFSIFDFEFARDIFDIGYKHACSMKKELVGLRQ